MIDHHIVTTSPTIYEQCLAISRVVREGLQFIILLQEESVAVNRCFYKLKAALSPQLV